MTKFIMTKFIQIDFHNPNIRAFDCFQDIEEALIVFKT